VFLGLFHDGFLLISFSLVRSNVLITNMIYDIFCCLTPDYEMSGMSFDGANCLLVLIAWIP
jgi:hypothetical protein